MNTREMKVPKEREKRAKSSYSVENKGVVEKRER